MLKHYSIGGLRLTGPASAAIAITARRAALVYLLTACCALTGPESGTSPMTLTELQAARHQLASRKRRIITNNDGCDCLYFPKDQELTPESFLNMRTTTLAGTHVDAIAYCTISSGFSNFTHATRLGTVLTRQSADYGIAPTKRNVTRDLIDSGADCLKLVLDYGHTHGMEVFWSMRMNDTHDVAHTPEKPYLLFPPLKEQHPEWLVGSHTERTPHGRWSSVNYAVPEIRDLALSYVEEVCRNYDLDGIELDFFRHPCFFPSVANGGTAAPAERDALTTLMRRIRTMTEQVGMARSRPILVAVRVADSVGFNRDIGLDLERWLSDGLVDLLITTCYFRLNPWRYSVELGRKHGVPVYPCLSDSRVRGETRFKRGSLPALRARAANAWAAGAAGIHTFNSFDPHSTVWQELGDPEALRTRDKLYFVTVRDGAPTRWLANATQYRTVPILTPARPCPITEEAPLDITIDINEDFDHAIRQGYVPRLTCHLFMPTADRSEQVRASINQHQLTLEGASDGWIDYSLSPEWIKPGTNSVRIGIRAGAGPESGTWTLEYSAAAGQPESPWHRDPGSPRTSAHLADGALAIQDDGTAAGDYLYYRHPWGIDVSGDVVVEARARVVSGTNCVIMADGRAGERLMLNPDHICLWHNRRARYDMDTTDGFHVYRIVIRGADIQVYVDGQLRIDAPGQFAARAGYPRNELAFGATNSPMTGEAHWNSVQARIAKRGHHCADVVVRVVYDKPGQ